jgi:hypothetical protein
MTATYKIANVVKYDGRARRWPPHRGIAHGRALTATATGTSRAAVSGAHAENMRMRRAIMADPPSPAPVSSRHDQSADDFVLENLARMGKSRAETSSLLGRGVREFSDGGKCGGAPGEAGAHTC